MQRQNTPTAWDQAFSAIVSLGFLKHLPRRTLLALALVNNRHFDLAASQLWFKIGDTPSQLSVLIEMVNALVNTESPSEAIRKRLYTYLNSVRFFAVDESYAHAGEIDQLADLLKNFEQLSVTGSGSAVNNDSAIPLFPNLISLTFTHLYPEGVLDVDLFTLQFCLDRLMTSKCHTLRILWHTLDRSSCAVNFGPIEDSVKAFSLTNLTLDIIRTEDFAYIAQTISTMQKLEALTLGSGLTTSDILLSAFTLPALHTLKVNCLDSAGFCEVLRMVDRPFSNVRAFHLRAWQGTVYQIFSEANFWSSLETLGINFLASKPMYLPHEDLLNHHGVTPNGPPTSPNLDLYEMVFYNMRFAAPNVNNLDLKFEGEAANKSTGLPSESLVPIQALPLRSLVLRGAYVRRDKPFLNTFIGSMSWTNSLWRLNIQTHFSVTCRNLRDLASLRQLTHLEVGAIRLPWSKPSIISPSQQHLTIRVNRLISAAEYNLSTGSYDSSDDDSDTNAEDGESSGFNLDAAENLRVHMLEGRLDDVAALLTENWQDVTVEWGGSPFRGRNPGHEAHTVRLNQLIEKVATIKQIPFIPLKIQWFESDRPGEHMTYDRGCLNEFNIWDEDMF